MILIDRTTKATYQGYTNFTENELKCTCCGEYNPNWEFHDLMTRVQILRDLCGFGLGVSSGYRCKNHPIEANKIMKGEPAGEHNRAAIDLIVDRYRAYKALMLGLQLGFSGIGLQQKEFNRFLHLDLRPMSEATIWTY